MKAKKQVYVFLFDGFSDWEISYLTPQIWKNNAFELIYFSLNGQAVRSMGGLHIIPTRSLSEVEIDKMEMLILPGGTAWENQEIKELDHFVLELFARKKAIAAICASTSYLAKLGLLNHVQHTSNDLTYLQWIVPEYSAQDFYLQSPAVNDQNIITASGIAPIEFAREIFLKLEVMSEQETERWFQLFKNGYWDNYVVTA